MIHHLSIDAENPLKVSHILAEILAGQVYSFLIPSSYLVIPYDSYGTHLVILQAGDTWHPGHNHQPAKIASQASTGFISFHIALSVLASVTQIERLGHQEGWRVLTRLKNDVVPFSTVELWVENRVLFELFPQNYKAEYLQMMQPKRIEQILGQPLEAAS